MDNRKRQEKEFHDNLRRVEGDSHVTATRWSPDIECTIKSNPLWTNMKYYSVERRSRQMVLSWFNNNCANKRVLDYCCGNGEDSRVIAQYGAKEVVGIDISEISIKNCIQLAAKEGVSAVTTYEVRDAEDTGFENDSFDIITEYGALHHIDLDKAFSEMARMLRSDGKIICNEALAHNPGIHLYRKLTPHLRTNWEVEHIMRKDDFERARKYFGKIELCFFHLFSLLAVPFRKTFLFLPLLSTLEGIDAMLLKIPGIRWWAWQVVVILSQPLKKE
jgi:ubiquinone/menaquinone biosynthesis C-methylase UbiE